MYWQVRWSDKSTRQLEKIGKKRSLQIYDAVLECAHNDPFKATTGLVNSQLYGLRAGDCEAILEIRQSVMVIFVAEASIRRKSCRK